MHESTRNIFPTFTRPLEGDVLWPYLDVLGLVTTGYGCLIDPVFLADDGVIPWKLTDGSLAPRDRIVADWHALKGRQDLARLHFKYAAAVTTIRLTEQDAADLLEHRATQTEQTLREYFPAWDSFPADGQLGLMSMAWACGGAFAKKFPRFAKDVNAGDWNAALAECSIDSVGNPGIVPRNAQDRLCFTNAFSVQARGLDPSTLHWPSAVPSAEQFDEDIRRAAQLALANHSILDIGTAGRHVLDEEA